MQELSESPRAVTGWTRGNNSLGTKRDCDAGHREENV